MSDVVMDAAGSGTLRLVDAQPADVALVRRHVNTPTTAESEDPLLTVRFVDRLQGGPRRFIGADHAVADGALLMRAGAGWARLPIGDARASEDLLVERSVSQVPHLVDLLNLAALHRGALPLHAAVLEVAGSGVLLTGWSKGGKTEAVLAAMADPAVDVRLVGDEWVHVDHALVARPLGYRMRLWDWQLSQTPGLHRRLPRRERRRLLAVGVARRLAPAALQPALARRHGSYLRPEEAFPGRLVPRTTVSRITLMESHAGDAVTAAAIAADDLTMRICASNRFERRGLLATYEALRFGEPAARDQRVEGAAALEERLVRERLGALPAQVLAHPYPVRLSRLAGLV